MGWIFLRKDIPSPFLLSPYSIAHLPKPKHVLILILSLDFV